MTARDPSAAPLLVLSQHAPPRLPEGERRRVALVPAGIDPGAAWWALLGQDPAAAWTGPAPLALASAGLPLAEDESAYLLEPVRVDGERVVEALALEPALRRALVERLRAALEGEGLAVHATPWGIALVLPERASGPPAPATPRALLGRPVDALPAGPPALLRRVVAAARAVCAAAPGPVTHLLPGAPSGPARMQPLREAWLGLGPVAAVGDEAWTRALALLLGCAAWPCPPGAELALAAERRVALVVAICPQAVAAEALPARVAVAGPPDARGALELAWRGAALGEPGPDLLRDLLCTRCAA
ncbi:MAG: hypothetical protein AB7N76_33015 [Planctomycetota bacterium]